MKPSRSKLYQFTKLAKNIIENENKTIFRHGVSLLEVISGLVSALSSLPDSTDQAIAFNKLVEIVNSAQTDMDWISGVKALGPGLECIDRSCPLPSGALIGGGDDEEGFLLRLKPIADSFNSVIDMVETSRRNHIARARVAIDVMPWLEKTYGEADNLDRFVRMAEILRFKQPEADALKEAGVRALTKMFNTFVLANEKDTRQDNQQFLEIAEQSLKEIIQTIENDDTKKRVAEVVEEAVVSQQSKWDYYSSTSAPSPSLLDTVKAESSANAAEVNDMPPGEGERGHKRGRSSLSFIEKTYKKPRQGEPGSASASQVPHGASTQVDMEVLELMAEACQIEDETVHSVRVGRFAAIAATATEIARSQQIQRHGNALQGVINALVPALEWLPDAPVKAFAFKLLAEIVRNMPSSEDRELGVDALLPGLRHIDEVCNRTEDPESWENEQPDEYILRQQPVVSSLDALIGVVETLEENNVFHTRAGINVVLAIQWPADMPDNIKRFSRMARIFERTQEDDLKKEGVFALRSDSPALLKNTISA